MMTTTTQPPSDPWTKRFILNGRVIPYTPPTPQPSTKRTSRSPSKHRPVITYQLSQPSLRYPYQLLFSKLEGLPIPPTISDSYLQSSAPLACQIRASLFDLQTGCFFGKTWVGKEVVDLRAKGRVALMRDGSIKGKKPPKPKKLPKRARRKQQSDDSDESDSDESYESSESGSESGDDEEREEVIVGHAIQGHRVNIGFREECLYLHTPLCGQHIVAILEFVFVVVNHPNEPEIAQEDFVSGGWTMIHLFDPERNGLDLEQTWSGDDHVAESERTVKLMPIFNGTPRILPFVAGSILSTSSGHANLATIPGAMFSYAFTTCPAVRSACHLWKENVWVAPGDEVPGLSITVDGISVASMESAQLSQLRIRIPQGILKYEHALLTNIADAHEEAFPGSLLVTADGSLQLPTIVERRVHIGLHNSYTFLAPPIITTLETVLKDDGSGSELVFNGNLELSKYMRNVNGAAVVFAVEYKVSMIANVEKAKKSGLTALLEKLGVVAKEGETTAELEKDVYLGWAVWDTYRHRSEPAPQPIAKPKTNLVDEATSPMSSPSEASSDSEIQPEPKPKPPPVIVDEKETELISVPAHPVSFDASQFPKPKTSKFRPALSRMEKARLLNAGFVRILDEEGNKPVQVGLGVGSIDGLGGGGQSVRPDLGIEFGDPRANDVTVTFMGLSFNDDFVNRVSGQFPSSVYFTFQFYNFAYSTTEALHVYTGPLPLSRAETRMPGHHRSSSVPTRAHARKWSHMSGKSFRSNVQDAEVPDEHGDLIWPGILYRVREDGTPAYDMPPGLSLSHLVNLENDTASLTSLRRIGMPGLPVYMAQNQLHIDVWDGESLLHVGSATAELKLALRQGRSAVEFDETVDIVMEEGVEEPQAGLRRSTSSSSVVSRADWGSRDGGSRVVVIGKLHLRVTNVARGAMDKTAIAARKAEQVVLGDFHQQVKLRRETMLPEVDQELHHVLRAAAQDRMKAKRGASKVDEGVELVDEKRRKLARLRRVREKENIVSPNVFGDTPEEDPVFTYQMSRQDRQRDLQTVDIFRERRKGHTIEEELKRQITTNHTVHASLGQAYYFEFLFQNPYNMEHNFEVSWDDVELRMITDSHEWKYLRRVHAVSASAGVEDKLFSVQPNGAVQLFMMPNETVAVPFVYQSFLGAVACQNADGGRKREGLEAEGVEESILARSIHISFINTHHVPVAFLSISIVPKPHTIDRVIRLFRPESEHIRRTVRFSIKETSSVMSSLTNLNVVSTIHDATNPGKRYLRCSHPDVVCSLADSGFSTTMKELTFKYRIGHAPETSVLYFLLYHDSYHTSLAEVWKVFVHSLYRMDITCVIGQTNHASLILRGSSFSRTVQCYANRPAELMITQPAPFLLTANALNEVGLVLRPREAAVKEVVVNVVDVDQRVLVNSWLVAAHCTTPNVTKTFDITVPKGRTVNKRVSYTNPYTTRKLLHLCTTHPHLLQFKEAALNLEGGETCYIGLRFLPVTHKEMGTAVGGVEVLVFLNDEADRIEECLCVRVKYD
ncbi:Nephrocystin-4 [Rhizophlyctis rosea]|nr:Nephrocystin-4 [Rhizophlyctis rosea]